MTPFWVKRIEGHGACALTPGPVNSSRSGISKARDAEELAHVAVFLSDIAVIVAPKHRLRVVKDEPDNRILECAVANRLSGKSMTDPGSTSAATPAPMMQPLVFPVRNRAASA